VRESAGDGQSTLTRSEKVNATKDGSHTADLAFLALAQYQLGKREEARVTLGRLRTVGLQTGWAKDD
jgi:hypothetical protein